MSLAPIPFREDDPFPLIESGRHDYRDAQLHSLKVDEWLGFQVDEIELAIAHESLTPFESRERWVGLNPSALQTPYTEIRTLFEHLSLEEGVVIDLGAAYGRMAFVLERHFPKLQFLGFEISKQRVDEANRVLKKNGYGSRLVWQDVARPTFQVPEAEVYFLYDFGTPESIQKALRDIQAVARDHPVKVVGRGRAVRDRIERHEFWLSDVVAPEHHGNFSIYRSFEG